ncbi:MAG: hypothetical protein ACYDG3_13110 [Bacillati bacterium]
MTKSAPQKFCNAVGIADNKRQECEGLIEELLATKDKNEVSGILESIKGLTGKSDTEIAKILYKSCPLCPEES